MDSRDRDAPHGTCPMRRSSCRHLLQAARVSRRYFLPVAALVALVGCASGPLEPEHLPGQELQPGSGPLVGSFARDPSEHEYYSQRFYYESKRYMGNPGSARKGHRAAESQVSRLEPGLHEHRRSGQEGHPHPARALAVGARRRRTGARFDVAASNPHSARRTPT